jgi:rhomboid protease GluP
MSQFRGRSTTSENDREPVPQGTVPRQQFAVQTPEVRPVVSYTLLAITILVYLAQMASQQLLGSDIPALMGMKVNDLIAEGQLWRLITPVFLHGGILHIGFNMYALFILGPGLERYFGHGRFLVLYFLAGFAGNVLSFMFSAAPSLGSSTAIFGLLGAQGVFVYRNQEVFGGLARRALTNVIWIAAVNLIIGMTPGIDNWGHMGGLIGGTIFAWFGGPLLVLQGVFPNFTVVDTRETRDWVLAAVIDGAIFMFLTALTLYMRY